LESKRFAHDGQEIKPGARIRHPSRLEQQRLLNLVTVVDQVNPDRWHAEVTFLGEVLITTEQFDNASQAAREAEAAFIKRLREVFSS
jgi:ADP-ribose pyrophosphatase YjhB (NUDIX family)